MTQHDTLTLFLLVKALKDIIVAVYFFSCFRHWKTQKPTMKIWTVFILLVFFLDGNSWPIMYGWWTASAP